VLVHANGVVGVIGLEVKPEVGIELGYWLAKPFWGRGLMTEAARAVLAAARAADPCAELLCSHVEDNLASQKVIAKLGFVPTGRTTRWSVSRDAEVTLMTYRLPMSSLPERAMLTAPAPVLTPA
jgi:RimJ/RimL family protein N-acetyltransferase